MYKTKLMLFVVAALGLSSAARAGTYAVVGLFNGIINLIPQGTQVANVGSGGDMVVDGSGNYYVASGSPTIIKATPGGVTSSFNTVAAGQYVSVTIDAAGNFIASNDVPHNIWRISPNGAAATLVAGYPVCSNSNLEDAYVRVNAGGNYVIIHDNCGYLSVYVMTPGGSVTPVTLSQTISGQVGGFTFDGSGNYIVTNPGTPPAVYQITPAGTVTTITQGGLLAGIIEGIARDPVTGNFIVTNRSANALISVTPAGVVSTAFSGSPLNAPQSLVILSGGSLATAPAPSTMLLGMVGVLALGWLLYRRA